MKRPHALWWAAGWRPCCSTVGRPPPAPPIRAITGPITSSPGNASLAPVATRSMTPQTVPRRSRTTRTMTRAPAPGSQAVSPRTPSYAVAGDLVWGCWDGSPQADAATRDGPAAMGEASR
jgi:hypothetical protein